MGANLTKKSMTHLLPDVRLEEAVHELQQTAGEVAVQRGDDLLY